MPKRYVLKIKVQYIIQKKVKEISKKYTRHERTVYIGLEKSQRQNDRAQRIRNLKNHFRNEC